MMNDLCATAIAVVKTRFFGLRLSLGRSAVSRCRQATILVIAGIAALGAADALAQKGGFRKLAPGVLTVIPPDKTSADELLHGDLLEVTEGLSRPPENLVWEPQRSPANTTLVERARGRSFPRDIWCLEFAFKPPRMIEVDIPAPDLKMQRKRIWYLVYRVKNTGGRRTVVDKDDPTKLSTVPFEAAVRFIPHFVLESLEALSDSEDLAKHRAYLDRVVPTAMEAIRRREDPRQRFYNSSEMVAKELAFGEERWGIAVWTDVDPRIDFFSIYASGLTNSIRWRKRKGAVINANDTPGSDMEVALESLRLDFWLPAAAAAAAEQEMSVGYRGMFERMTLGSRVLEAAGWPVATKSNPAAALERMGLTWDTLLEPAGGGGPSLLPLEKVLGTIAAQNPAVRTQLVREMFGEVGEAALESLAAAAAGPVDAEQDKRRRAALQAMGLTPELVAKDPYKSLAQIAGKLDSQPGYAERQAMASRCFGPAGRRLEWLSKGAKAARALAALESIAIDPASLATGNAQAAFDAVRPSISALGDPAVRQKVLQGVFGPRGPDLFAAAVAVHEGIDHDWVFRYDSDGPGL
jgi:hypothetical protein